MSHRPRKLTALAVAIQTLLFSCAAHAQNTESPAAGGPSQTIVISGFRASLESSIALKRNSSNFSEAITSEDMGKFPDLNLSESLQRVPGITIDRNINGEGRQINLRGLGPQFTRVEIDGMTGLPNGTGGRLGVSQSGRAFNFEILPSELFSRAVVDKSVTADMTEGGMAGVVQLSTPKPLDRKGSSGVVGLLGSYSSNTGKADPRGYALWSRNWDGVFGLAGTIAASKPRFVTDTAEAGSWRPFAAVNGGTRAPDGVRSALVANGPRYYHYAEDNTKVGGTLTAQYKPDKSFQLTLDTMFGRMKAKARALRDDMATESGLNSPLSTTIEDGVITAGQFTGVQQRVGDNFLGSTENLSQAVLSANWQPNSDWTIKPSLGHGQRKADRTWNLYSFRLAQNGVFDPGVVSYRVRGNFLDFSSTATDFNSNPQNFLFNVFVFRPTSDTINETQGKLDFERRFDGVLNSLKFGLRASDTVKDRVASQSRLNVASGVANAAVPNLSSVADSVSYNVSGAVAPSSLLGVNESLISSVFFPGGAPVTGTAVRQFTGFGAQNTYTIKERPIAAYVSGEFESGSARYVTGLRLVSTRQESIGSSVANVNLPTQQVTPVSVSRTYTSVLPSLAARWELGRKTLIRASVSRTLTRPDYDSLAPSETVSGIDASGGTGTKGNPQLKPYYSNNLDFGGEYYLSRNSYLAANLFVKQMKGFIDTQTFVENRTYPRQADGVLVTGPITFSQPVNSVTAQVKGLELAAQTSLDFVSPNLAPFGLLANVTMTDSSADFSTANDVRNRGLPGLSKRSMNGTVYYAANGLDVRFSYAWRSRYLAQFSDDFGVPRFTNAYGQLDFSANYDVNKDLSLQLQALNLTRNQEVNVSSSRDLPYGVNQLDRRIMLGARMKF